MWKQLKTLNLFRSSTTVNDSYQLKNERISTRIYLATLSILLLMVIIYTAQITISHTVHIKSLTFGQYLTFSQQYPDTLHCTCQYVSVSYRSFLDIQPQFHQLCKSEFVQQDWIDHLKSAENRRMNDFTYIGTLIFHLLASFCRSTSQAVSNAIDKFLANQLISHEIFQQDRFDQQMQATMENFRLSIELSYSQMIWSLANVTKINQIMSSLFGDVMITVPNHITGIAYSQRPYNNNTCTCDINRSCADPLTLYYHSPRMNTSFIEDFVVPGFYRSCYVNEAARRSSLQCFYDVSCINIIETYLQTRTIFNHSLQPLNASAHDRFHPSSTIDEILRSLMIEQWINITSYQQYFQECQIESCTYTYTSRLNLTFIISTLIALIGGLMKALRLTIPRLVKWIRRKLVPPPISTRRNPLTIEFIYKKIRELNLFSKRSATVNADDERKEILATRLFLFLLMISLIIILVYYSAIRVNVYYEVLSPSYEKYLKLQHEHGSNPSFTCPCSKLAISHETFFQIDYIFHPLCLDTAMVKLTSDLNQVDSDIHDFRSLFRVYFLSFSQLCQLAYHSIETSISIFNASVYVTDEMIPDKTFHEETQKMIGELIPSFRRSFSHPILFMANFTRVNELMNTKVTGFILYPIGANGNYTIRTVPIQYVAFENNIPRVCDCFVSGQCSGPIQMARTTAVNSETATIPGFYRSCSIMEGLLVSSWACFFNQSCIDMISSFANISRLTTLSGTALRRSTPLSTNRELIDYLFVEEWHIHAFHRQFFHQCQPNHCSYMLSQNNSWIIIFTTIFGLFGGLTKILQIISLPLVRGLFSLYVRFKRRQHPQRNIRNHLSIEQLIDRLRKLNLFPSTDPQLDTEDDQRKQLIATRIFIALFIIIIVILTIYSSQISVMHELSIPHPSLEKYSMLFQQHSNTLVCPCEQVMMKRQRFLTSQPQFHQVCQSNFIHPAWSFGIAMSFAKLYSELYPRATFFDLSGIPMTDFRSIGPPFFRSLLTLCNISNMIVRDRLQDFSETSFPTTQLLSKQILEKQGQALIDLLHSSVENEFNSFLQLNQDWVYTNDFLTGVQPALSLSWISYTENDSYVNINHKLFKTSNGFCSCFENRHCIEQVTFYNSSDVVRRYPNPKLYYGCFILDALLQSDLAFLYDQNWIDEIRQLIDFDWTQRLNLSTPALNASLLSRYNPSTPLSAIVQNMMIEKWYKNVNYSAYFDQCRPVECRYTYEVKYDVIYIITTVIGLIDGVMTILQITIPVVIQFIYKCYVQRRRRRTIVCVIVK